MATYIKQPRKPNKPPPDFETEWISDNPKHHNTQRFSRIMAVNDTRQLAKFKSMTIPETIPPVNITTIYAVKQKKWVLVGHKCIDCGKPMNDPEVLAKHSLVCRNDKEINRLEEQSILDRIGKPAILPELPDDLLDEE